jgi:hypothetical protein
MTSINSDAANLFAKIELKDPAKKPEFDKKVQESLSDGVLTKEEFTKLKEDFKTKDGVSFDKVLAGLPSDAEVKASVNAIPGGSNSMEALKARYEKVLPDLGRMLGVLPAEKPQSQDNSQGNMFVHIDPDPGPTLQPMEVQDVNLVLPLGQKKTPPDGMFVHIDPDPAPKLQPMEENDPSIVALQPKKTPPDGMFVHIDPDPGPKLQPMEVQDVNLVLPPAQKKTPPDGMFVHIDPDPGPTLQPMEVNDPSIVVIPPKKTPPDGMFVHIDPDPAPKLEPMVEQDPFIELAQLKPKN